MNPSIVTRSSARRAAQLAMASTGDLAATLSPGSKPSRSRAQKRAGEDEEASFNDATAVDALLEEDVVVGVDFSSVLASPPVSPDSKSFSLSTPKKPARKKARTVVVPPTPPPPTLLIASTAATTSSSSSSPLELPPTHPHATHPAILHLVKNDPKFGQHIANTLVPCALLQDPDHTDTFRALVTSIIYQQLAGSAASAILRKFIAVFYPEVMSESVAWDRSSTVFPTPTMILAFSPEQLKIKAGLSQSKANFIHGLAGYYSRGELTDEMLKSADEERVRELLLPVKGIGPWTVDMWVKNVMKAIFEY